MVTREEKSCGAVVYCISDEKPVFLALQSKKHGHWGFPKGHVVDGETEVETAKREIFEECGANVVIDQSFRNVKYYDLKNCVRKEVVYFTGYADNDNVTICKEEILAYKWCDYKTIIRILTYESDKEVLKSAYEHITRTMT